MKRITYILIGILFLFSLCSCDLSFSGTAKEVQLKPTISLDNEDTTLKVGDTLILKEKVTNFDGEVTWYSTDEEVASIDDGVVKALKEGTSNVGCYILDADNKKFSAEIVITVEEEELPPVATWKVDFLGKDGSLLLSQQVEDGTAATAPDVPEVEGYNFTGWDKTFAKVTKDLTVTAKYSAIKYTITYNLNIKDTNITGTAPKSPTTYTIESAVTLPNATGNVSFLGWYDNPECEGTKITSIPKGTTGDIEVYGKWAEYVQTNFTITYVYDEGEPEAFPCTSVSEFSDYFFHELYAWSGSTLAFDTFKNNCLNAWKAGNAYNAAKVYGASISNVHDEAYFVSCEANYDMWMPWANKFDQLVNEINGSQSAWGSTYVGYLRLYAFLMQSASYWNATRNAQLYSMIKIKSVLPTSYEVGTGVDIPNLSINDGREFLGWYDNPECEGTKITKISSTQTGNITLYAKWPAKVVATDFDITYPDKIELFDTYQLTWSFDPTNTSNKNLIFTSSNPQVLDINNKGVISTYKTGKATISVRVLSNEELNTSFEVEVYYDPFIDGAYKTSSILGVGETIELIATLYGETGTIEWTSLNPSIATVNDGIVTGVSIGYAEIVASVQGSDTKFTFGVTVSSDSDEIKLLNDAHNAESYVTRDLHVAYEYYTDVTTSVSDLLFNREYYVDPHFESIQAANDSNHGGKLDTVEFICVHYTAGATASSTAYNTASYMCGTDSVSIHYTTGNDGIYHCVANDTIAWHAGDGTGVKFQWYATGVMATENVKPVWGCVRNSASSTGWYFTLNGQATTIEVPTSGKTSSGATKVMEDPNKCFTYFGPAWKIVNGQYYMGSTWACFTQTLAGAISSRGGNRNSIGIETACNRGSDLWYTYQITAQLVARLVTEYNLDLTRVVGHNAFSGKDCPQTLLANNGELWEIFMECVEAEYNKFNNFDDNYSVEFESHNEDLVNNYGRILSIPRYSTTVSYTLKITNKQTGDVTYQTYSTIIHGSYTE